MSFSTAAELLVPFSYADARAAAAPRLARAAGAERLVLLVRDPQLDVLLPVLGMPQTLRGGPRWREFVARCGKPGRHEDEIDLPADELAGAVALSTDGAALVLIGGRPIPGVLKDLEQWLPMLAATLRAEQEVRIAISEAREAREAAGRAASLAESLESARAEHARLNAELRTEQRRKDEFLAMLAHELRNPLAPLTYAIELLRRDETRNHGPMLDIARRQLDLMGRLVDDLLDVSRVSRGRVELRRKNMPLADALTRAVESVQALITERHHDLRVDIADELLLLHADQARLTQIFANLLSNAVKYTDPGGRIEISATREANYAVVHVTDSGIGIAPEMLERVFDLFTQATVSIARSHGGLGIGLTLARSLVRLHGGDLRATSAGPGKGSTFTVRLPLADPAVATTPGEADAQLPSRQPLDILVVDDNRDAADTLAALLRAADHRVRIATSAASGLAAVGETQPELVLLDLGLPDLDGFEVASRLRRSLGERVRLVALTGYGGPDYRRRCREAGFDEHAVKPLPAEALAGILDRAAAHLNRQIKTA